MKIVEQVDARKNKIEADEAVAIAREANHLWVAKGKQARHINLKKDEPTDEELASILTGRSGTLRAPTIRRGKKLFVGFNAEEYAENLLK